jgi:glycosyltransferase involved in cell wall biosynthesis
MIAFSATNPCHLYHMARELFRRGLLRKYYSGYPAWKLGCPDGFPLAAFSFRTVAVYAALKFLPLGSRPDDQRLFRWQDDAFDGAVARSLVPALFLHAMPGQCLRTFRAAKRMGIVTVLNHATGPVAHQRAVIDEECRRLGLPVPLSAVSDRGDEEREEYALADWHCVASQIVRRQLVEEGVAEDKIWVVPYGADSEIFHPGIRPPDPAYRIIFAGQITLRKGFHHLLNALAGQEASAWTLDAYGRVSPDIQPLLAAATPKARIQFHGAVNQHVLAAQFCQGSVLVLPSLEEGFGLVVAQALACGLPCIVSDQVGAADLIRHRVNGSIVPVGNSHALREELRYWCAHRRRIEGGISWRESATRLVALSRLPSPARPVEDLVHA